MYDKRPRGTTMEIPSKGGAMRVRFISPMSTRVQSAIHLRKKTLEAQKFQRGRRGGGGLVDVGGYEA